MLRLIIWPFNSSFCSFRERLSWKHPIRSCSIRKPSRLEWKNIKKTRIFKQEVWRTRNVLPTCFSLLISCSSSASRVRVWYSCSPAPGVRPLFASASSLYSCRCSNCLRRSSITWCANARKERGKSGKTSKAEDLFLLFFKQTKQSHLLSVLLLLLVLVSLVTQLVGHLPAWFRLLLQPIWNRFHLILKLPLLLRIKTDTKSGEELVLKARRQSDLRTDKTRCVQVHLL